MRKIREVLRLHHELQASGRQIARSVGIGRKAVQECLGRAAAAGIVWPLAEGESDATLEQRLYPVKATQDKQMPDWQDVLVESKRKGVTLRLLWQEYRQRNSGGLGYSRFCESFRDWHKGTGLVMHQEHKAGESLYVDYAGMKVAIRDLETGQESAAVVFVGVLGASEYIFAEATPDATSRYWLGSHVRCFEYMGGVAESIVPDNLKTGVLKACRYEPEINLQYAALAQHYGCVVLPARVRHPRDKALVENSVLQVERRILAALRDRVFFSCGELNAAMRELLVALNEAPLTNRGISRRELFLTVDRPALRPLPAEQFTIWSVWAEARVNIDYHVQFAKSYYSVPHQLKHQRVEVRATTSCVEILHKGARVAIHRRAERPHTYVTCPDHMPAHHRQYSERSPQRMLVQMRRIGPVCAQWADAVLNSRLHPELGYRACLGVIRLAGHYPPSRVEAACKRALHFALLSFKSVSEILARGLDQEPLEQLNPLQGVRLFHENVRGPVYYQPHVDN